MQIHSFSFITKNLLYLHYENGQTLPIRLNENSGRGIWRNKIDSLMNVKHTGIYLGKIVGYNADVIIHNHYRFGSAYVASFSDFAQNQDVFWLNQQCINQPLDIINKALKLVVSGEPYKALSNNCQTFVNNVCNNKRTSEDVNRILGYTAVTIVLGCLLYLIAKRS